jgi:adenine-specific DNA-methyltransferase
MFGNSGLFLSPKSSKFVKKFIFQSTKKDSWFSDFFGGSGSSAHAIIQANREDGGTRKFFLVEMGHYFDWLTKPRVLKALYASEWKSGTPRSKDSVSAFFKVVRLESYEDCLNNLEFKKVEAREKVVPGNRDFHEDYMLHYMLETETRGSQSLLNIDRFNDPTAYKLKVKKLASDEYEVRNVDLIETFNYLIGLRVEHMDVPQSFYAEFKREPDPELPDDKHTRLKLASRKKAKDGPWWFRKIEGWIPGDNGRNEKVLIVWRKLTGDQEKDNLMLDEWFKSIRVNPRDFEFDTIYVNGSNNLPNLRLEGENWKVRLIEEDFMKRMWEVEDV